MRKHNNNNLKAVSKSSEMLDNIRQLCAQWVSKMSKMTKMYFIKEKLNQTSKLNIEKHSVLVSKMSKMMGLPVMLVGRAKTSNQCRKIIFPAKNRTKTYGKHYPAD